MKHFMIFACALLMLASCKKEDSWESRPRRTVIVYMSGENKLSQNDFINSDIQEMIEGRKAVADNENLIIYVDRANAAEKPFIARITKNQNQPVDTLYRFSDDHCSADPAVFQEVLRWVVNNCPATEDYALVLWGHANGWVMENDHYPTTASAPRRAYGIDNGRNSKTSNSGPWMNIPAMRQALEAVGVKWKFIFCDCCNMQCVEVAYELRSVCYYFIASPAEITGVGAPYDTMVADFFIHDVETMCTGIVNDYHAQRTDNRGVVRSDGDCQLPICAMRSNKMQALADATRTILPQVASYVAQEGATDGVIFYYNYKANRETNTFPESEDVLYDMNMVMERALGSESTEYSTWKTAFGNAVYKVKESLSWHANTVNFSRFADATTDSQGCVSMFFPLSKYESASHAYNTDIRQMQWYQAIDASLVGW